MLLHLASHAEIAAENGPIAGTGIPAFNVAQPTGNRGHDV